MQTQMTQTMTAEQFEKLKSIYCAFIIEGMDVDCLTQMAYDMLLESYADVTEEQLKEEIADFYDGTLLQDLMEEAVEN